MAYSNVKACFNYSGRGVMGIKEKTKFGVHIEMFIHTYLRVKNEELEWCFLGHCD